MSPADKARCQALLAALHDALAPELRGILTGVQDDVEQYMTDHSDPRLADDAGEAVKSAAESVSAFNVAKHLVPKIWHLVQPEPYRPRRRPDMKITQTFDGDRHVVKITHQIGAHADGPDPQDCLARAWAAVDVDLAKIASARGAVTRPLEPRGIAALVGELVATARGLRSLGVSVECRLGDQAFGSLRDLGAEIVHHDNDHFEYDLATIDLRVERHDTSAITAWGETHWCTVEEQRAKRAAKEQPADADAESSQTSSSSSVTTEPDESQL